MHRLGAILMILGANIAVAAVAAAFWRASFECALEAAGGTCYDGALGVFVKLMLSGTGLAYWVVMIIGMLVFWRGKRMRAR